MKQQGRFIVFEGIDGVGKTCQMEQTKVWWEKQGYPVVLTREPGGCPLGQDIRQMLLDPQNKNLCPEAELLLYAADRAQHTKEVILPALNRGDIVLSDRYALSTVAYQGYGRALDMTMIQTLNTIATQGLYPDLTILMDLNRTAAKERILANRGIEDRMEQENDTFFETIRQGYLTEAKANPSIAVVNANQTPEAVFAEIKALLENI